MNQVNIATIDNEVNLCEEILKLMHRMNFKQEAFDSLIISEEYNFALGSPNVVQRTNLILYYNNLFLLSGEPTPNNVRRALIISEQPVDWLSDMSSVVLHHLLVNQDFYFPSAQ